MSVAQCMLYFVTKCVQFFKVLFFPIYKFPTSQNFQFWIRNVQNCPMEKSIFLGFCEASCCAQWGSQQGEGPWLWLGHVRGDTGHMTYDPTHLTPAFFLFLFLDFFLDLWFYPNTSRDSVSSMCRIFLMSLKTSWKIPAYRRVRIVAPIPIKPYSHSHRHSE